MRLGIYETKGVIYDQVTSYLKRNNIGVNPIRRVTAHTLTLYEAIIFTEDNNVPNLTKVIEQVILEQHAAVIYVHTGQWMSHLYNMMHNPFFIEINHKQLDLMFNPKINLSLKYIQLIKVKNKELEKITSDYNDLKNELKAKRLLIKKGLDEEESHRFIQDKAMQLRKPKKDIVNLIIRNKIDL